MNSFLKTLVLLGAALAAAIVVAVVGFTVIGGVAGAALGALGALASIATCVAIAAGLVVVRREARRVRGERDLFLEYTDPRREPALDRPDGFRAGPLRRWLARRVLGHDFLPGDVVRVRPLPEILATLDGQAALDGMPFQPEMIPFCGREARVFRCLDKIYDYGRTKRMRRLEGCVLLGNMHCDGSAHDGCEADCYLIWKTEWLQRVDPSGQAVPAPAAVAPVATPEIVAAATRRGDVFRCQFTDLHGCTREYPRTSLERDLVPLLSGNYSAKAWSLALLTRLFNAIQAWRGSVQYPPLPPIGEHRSADVSPLNAGDRVVVLPIETIARTLNKQGKNKGLWFDVEMVRHCGREYRVSRRVQKIVDDATGQIRQMKTPCIMLEGCDSTGEGLHFNPQHDPIFWRESWLGAVDAPAADTAGAGRPVGNGSHRRVSAV
jgi:hypothetical protein